MVRRIRFATLVVVVSLYLPNAVWAALITNSPRPIAYRVNVQLIQTALDDGSLPATVLGDSTQRANIEAKIDTIWAQAGIDINFLPNVVRYNNSFACRGNDGSGTRPTSDLLQLIAGATTAGGILNPDSSVIDMFFVNVVPGWPPVAPNWVAGQSIIGASGIAEFVGSSQPSTDRGQEWIAHWIAHEIGHNLGLFHSETGAANLMNATTKISEQLTPDQVDAVLQRFFHNDAIAFIPQNGTGFPKLIPQPVPGDYNRDGNVDAADYIVWRSTLGSNTFMAADGNNNDLIDLGDFTTWKANFGAHIQSPSLPGDFNRDGKVDAADYSVWRHSLGASVAFGTGADANLNGLIDAGDYTIWQLNFGATGLSGTSASSATVPEPAAQLLAVIAVTVIAARRCRRILVPRVMRPSAA